MSIDIKEAELISEKLMRSISGILDRNQQLYALGKKLKKLDDEMILEVFRFISSKARDKVPMYQDGFRALSDVRKLSRYVGHDKMSRVYTLARGQDYQDVVRIMYQAPPARSVKEKKEIEQDLFLQDITLGRRRSLARTRDRDIMDRLCHEQDPVIIEHLLQNPAITVREVIKIASKRPTSQEILWTIYRNARWANHYSIKMSLVSNPYSPPQMALSLVHFLLEQDLEDVAENQTLHKKIREAAVEILLERRGLTENK